MARVLVGVEGNSTRSLSASFLAVPGVYARHRENAKGSLSLSHQNLKANSNAHIIYVLGTSFTHITPQ
jgi:hypothetical protein